jgi:hypothetical protein
MFTNVSLARRWLFYAVLILPFITVNEARADVKSYIQSVGDNPVTIALYKIDGGLLHQFAIVRIRGSLGVSNEGITEGHESLVDIKTRDYPDKWLEIRQRELVQGRVVITTADGKVYTIFNLANDFTGRIEPGRHLPSADTKGATSSVRRQESRTARSGQTRFQGVRKCGAVEVEVSFVHDQRQRKVWQFKAVTKCSLGGTHQLWEVETEIVVGNDGEFYYEESPGRWVRGKIESHQPPSLHLLTAEGTFPDGQFLLLCDNGEYYPACTEWEAVAEE